MARLKKNSLLNSISGAIGKEIVLKQYADKVVVSIYPDMSKVKPSELQKLQSDKIREANAFASAVLKDPKLRAKYKRKLKKGESVFHKTKKTFLRGGKVFKRIRPKIDTHFLYLTSFQQIENPAPGTQLAQHFLHRHSKRKILITLAQIQA